MSHGIVYYWHCSKSGMGYVGQTINTLYGRWKGHVHSALNPKSKIGHWELPKAIREHGAESFTGKILCECETPEQLSLMEAHWMHELNTLWPNGYNMRDGVNFVCEQTRQLISQRTREAMMNRDPLLKEQQKQRQREAYASTDPQKKIARYEQLGAKLRGKKRSEETKQRMRKPRINPRSAEHCQKLSEANRGKKLSEETKRKIGDASRGRVLGPMSDETKRKLSQSSSITLIGRPVSNETRRKIGEANSALTKEQRQQVVTLLLEGASLEKLAMMFDVSKTTIRRIRAKI